MKHKFIVCEHLIINSFYMYKDIFLDRTSKTTYNHLAYMFSFTFIVNIHISKYKKGEYV